MTGKLLIRIANTVLFAAMITVNILADAIPLGDFSTGQISAMYPTLITPPGWTFIIWGLIYALLAVYVIRQMVSEPFYESVNTGPYFLLSCLMNIAWIFSWHFRNIGLALLTILALFSMLLFLYLRTRKADFLTRTAFSVYFAWITVASLIMIFAAIKSFTGHAPVTPIIPKGGAAAEASGTAAVSDLFTGIVLISGNPEIVSYVTVFEYLMAIGALIVLTIIVIEHSKRHRDIAYLAVILWALAGILIRQVTSITPPILFSILCAISLLIAAYMMIRIIVTKTERKENAMNTRSKVNIYTCNVCGNTVFMLEDSGVNPVCCGSDMEHVTAKTTDEFHEKHVPVITENGDRVTVTVGSVPHPMTGGHHIRWILLETTKGIHIAWLEAEAEPTAHFNLSKSEAVVAAYAYCNLHGLWMGVCC